MLMYLSADSKDNYCTLKLHFTMCMLPDVASTVGNESVE